MERKRRAAVVVLGDFGRSPRMQYHALSLARQAQFEVDIIAYKGTEPHNAVRDHPNIHLLLMDQPFSWGLPRFLYLLVLPVKAVLQFVMLLWYICVKIQTPDLFLVQNPPSVPTLIAVQWACLMKKSAFFIDWHNFGYTLLGLGLGRSHPLVKLYQWCERYYGRKADGCLCVTKAMQHELAQNWEIKATVVYDRSPEFFHPTTLEEKHELFCSLHTVFTSPLGSNDCCSIADKVHNELQTSGDIERQNNGRLSSSTTETAETTLFTSCSFMGNAENSKREITMKDNRPALIISSTSWTRDEDFDILLEAAIMYDRRVSAILNESDHVSEEILWKEFLTGKTFTYPRLLFVITGKGPEKQRYEDKIKRLHLKRVAFRTVWLPAADYPLLLGSADLGISLHTSSSGLDLPMKVVDMFGCGLPVCAVAYSCIEELVKVDKNGLLFSSSSDLAGQLLDLFKGFPSSCHNLSTLQRGALETGSSAKWADEWEDHVLPLLTEVGIPALNGSNTIEDSSVAGNDVANWHFQSLACTPSVKEPYMLIFYLQEAILLTDMALNSCFYFPFSHHDNFSFYVTPEPINGEEFLRKLSLKFLIILVVGRIIEVEGLFKHYSDFANNGGLRADMHY